MVCIRIFVHIDNVRWPCNNRWNKNYLSWNRKIDNICVSLSLVILNVSHFYFRFLFVRFHSQHFMGLIFVFAAFALSCLFHTLNAKKRWGRSDPAPRRESMCVLASYNHKCWKSIEHEHTNSTGQNSSSHIFTFILCVSENVSLFLLDSLWQRYTDWRKNPTIYARKNPNSGFRHFWQHNKCHGRNQIIFKTGL